MKIAEQSPQTVSRPETITPQHWQYLTGERRLAPDWVAVNFRSMTDKEASEYLGYPAKSDGIMLIGERYQWQFRPDVPWEAKDGTFPKYRACKEDDGHDLMLPRHPQHSGYWRLPNGQMKSDCWKMDGEPCIILTEGHIKAVTLTHHGIPTVSVLGVEMGLTGKDSDPEDKRYLVDELRRQAERGFGFIIAFDADCATNPNVVKAQTKLGEQLQKLDVPVYSITGQWTVDDGKGVDDYINKHGIDKFKREVMRKAETFTEWRERAEKQFQAGKRDKTPSEADVADELADEYRELYRYHESFMSWRFWNGKFWEQQTDKRMEGETRATIKARGYKFKKSAFYNDVVRQMSDILNYGDWTMADRERYVNCQNGILDLETGEVMPHQTGFNFTSVLPYDINPIPKTDNLLLTLKEHCPTTFNFLMSCTGYDDKQATFLLAVVAGVLRWQFSKHQKFVHLTGLPGSGKGTFLRLLQDIVGEDNYASSDLRAISATNSEYEFSRIINKQLAVFPDERSTVGIDAILKMCGGDSIRFREPYGKPGNAPFWGTVVLASNTPVFKGDTTGLDRRLILVEFPNPVPADERDPALNSKLRLEMSSLIPIALMIDSDTFATQLRGVSAEMSPRHKALQWEQKCENDAIAAWLDECITFDEFGQEPARRLYKSYEDYCSESRRSPVNMTRFGRGLDATTDWLGFKVDKIKTGGLMTRVGLRLKTDSERETLPLVSDIIAPPSGTVSGDSLDSLGTVGGTVQTPSGGGLGTVGIVFPNNLQKTPPPSETPPATVGEGSGENRKDNCSGETIPTIPNAVREGDATVQQTVPPTIPQTVQTPTGGVDSSPRDKNGEVLAVGDRVRYIYLFSDDVPDGTGGNITNAYTVKGGEWRVIVQWDKTPNGKKRQETTVDPSVELVKSEGWN